MSFAASRAAQSDTRPGLAAGLGTAMALEHWAYVGMGTTGEEAVAAVAPSAPVSSRDMASADARARAIAVLIARVGMDGMLCIWLCFRAWL